MLGIGAAAAQAATARRSPSGPAPADALTRALDEGRLTAGEYALERALSLFDLAGVRARYGAVARPDPREATLILRDLAIGLAGLSPRERRVAESLLARPTTGFLPRPDDNGVPNEHRYSPAALGASNRACAATFCISWVQATADAVPPADTDADGLPDYVEAVSQVVQQVWDAEVDRLGFRPPKSDADSPNSFNVDGRIDIYLADVGADRIFGYCTSDDPKIRPGSTYPGLDASAYCVLDNDFSPSQFPGVDPLDALRVTAAHEFFHAIQFAYNFFQDNWLLEGSAVWIEDEVYDDVNDYFRYLSGSPIANPAVPLDLASYTDGARQYGTFTFFKHLSETVGPVVVREIFEAGDGVPGAPARYSVFAIDQALRRHRTTLREAFQRFGVWNIRPATFYDEGATWRLPDEQGNAVQASVPLPPPITLTVRRPTLATRAVQLDHLTNGYVSFRPGGGVRPGARLLATLDLPEARSGSAASLVTISRSGRLSFVPVRLNARGDASRRIPFGRVREVILVLTNASTRYAGCGDFYGNPEITCGGVALDDDLPYRFSARLAG